MGRTRVAMAGMAAVVGVAAIAAGVHLSMRETHDTLAADTAHIPEADVPTTRASHGANGVTATTSDLNVLAPSTTDAPSPTTPTTHPASLATAVSPGYVLVRVNNASGLPAHVFLGDGNDFSTDLAAGTNATWVVRTVANRPDSGGARVPGTGCGATWSGVNNVVGGHEYHFEVKSSNAYCANGQRMPMLVLTDYTAGSSRVITGLVPDETHALVYVHNLSSAPVKLTVADGDTIEWTMDPLVWGAAQRLTTSGDDDSASVTQGAETTTAAASFVAGHTYRVDVTDGPALHITDLTA